MPPRADGTRRPHPLVRGEPDPRGPPLTLGRSMRHADGRRALTVPGTKGCARTDDARFEERRTKESAEQFAGIESARRCEPDQRARVGCDEPFRHATTASASSRTVSEVPVTTGTPSRDTCRMKSAILRPEKRAACPRGRLRSRNSAVASARRMPGSASSESSSRCTSSASGRCRLSTITGCSRASRSAADGLFFNSRTLKAFIPHPSSEPQL